MEKEGLTQFMHVKCTNICTSRTPNLGGGPKTKFFGEIFGIFVT